MDRINHKDRCFLHSVHCDAKLKEICLKSLDISFVKSLSEEERDALCFKHTLPHEFFNISKSDNESLDISDNALLHIICELSQQTELLLSEGGDNRLCLNIENGKRNIYHSSSFPKDDIVKFSSCTSSTISTKNFVEVDKLKYFMLKSALEGNKEIINECNTDIRMRILNAFGLDRICFDIILCPSGTDAEYVPLLMGLITHHQQYQQSKDVDTLTAKIVSFTVCGNEVGSGTVLASSGKHFSNISINKKTVISSGQDVEEPPENHYIQTVEVKARSRAGEVHTNDLEEWKHILHHKLGIEHPHAVGVMHVVWGSKTGILTPSLETATAIQSLYPGRLLIVVDCCQMRCKKDVILSFLQRNFIVLITGSKFFSGVPFSGGVLFSAGMREMVETYLKEYLFGNANETELSRKQDFLLSGIRHYLTPEDISNDMPCLREYITTSNAVHHTRRWVNAGLTLRWTSALSNIEPYMRIPQESIDDITRQWVGRVVESVKCHVPYITVLEENASNIALESMNGDCCSIVSIVLQVPNLYGNLVSMSKQQLQKVCRLMIDANVFGPSVSLGQPVDITGADVPHPKAVVRIAISAPIVTSVYQRIQEQQMYFPEFADIKVGVEKLVKVCQSFWPHGCWYGAMKEHYLRDKQDSISSSALRLDKLFHSQDACFLSKDPESSLKFPGLASTHRLCRAAHTLLGELNNRSHNSGETMSHVDDNKVMMLYDLDSLTGTCRSLINAFDSHFLHCFAMKSCPLSYIVHRCVTLGLGVETASIMEMRLALHIGCEPSKVIFDSPCKSRNEFLEALLSGVHVNLNTVNELEKVKEVMSELSSQNIASSSVIGLRINPLVGRGDILALSTAIPTSKFGVQLTASSRNTIINYYREYTFLTSIMCHIGSQGMSQADMATSVVALVQLADDIDKACNGPRITRIDIGGGLSVNYTSDEVTPSFVSYADAIRLQCPQIYENKNRLIVTEFGKAIIAKSAGILAYVEDVFSPEDTSLPFVAITHAGADLLLRTAYCPHNFSHRVSILDSKGNLKAKEQTEGEGRLVTVAGPLCFSGDIIIKDASLPVPCAGDFALIHDAGANTISLFSRHCSRQAPSVYCYSNARSSSACSEVSETVVVIEVKSKEDPHRVFDFWRC